MQHWATDWNSLKEERGGEEDRYCVTLAELKEIHFYDSFLKTFPSNNNNKTMNSTKLEITLTFRHITRLVNLLFNLRGTVHKVMAPELEGRVLDQLDEGDEETPWVRPVHDQPLQQNPERGAESLNFKRP